MTISPLQVMQSAAGFYLGHGYNDPDMGMKPEDGFPLPYSRETWYMSKEEAEQLLIEWSK